MVNPLEDDGRAHPLSDIAFADDGDFLISDVGKLQKLRIIGKQLLGDHLKFLHRGWAN